jgi:hypothetical protein
MELLMNEHRGVVAVTRFPDALDTVWHRIERFTVSKDKRPDFERGYAHSATAQKNKEVKGSPRTMLKLWRTMGLCESELPDGSLQFEYSLEVFLSLQKQTERAGLKRKGIPVGLLDRQPAPSKRAAAAKQQAIAATEHWVVAEQRAIAAEQRAIAAEQRALAAEYRATAIAGSRMDVSRLLN